MSKRWNDVVKTCKLQHNLLVPPRYIPLSGLRTQEVYLVRRCEAPSNVDSFGMNRKFVVGHGCSFFDNPVEESVVLLSEISLKNCEKITRQLFFVKTENLMPQKISGNFGVRLLTLCDTPLPFMNFYLRV